MSRARQQSRPGEYSLVDAEAVLERLSRVPAQELTPVPTAVTERPGAPAKGLPLWLLALVGIIGPGGATALVQAAREDPAASVKEDVRLLSLKVDGVIVRQDRQEEKLGRLETERIEREVARRVREELARSHLARSRDPEARRALDALEGE